MVQKTQLNVPFCFQCTFGGDLICCEGCPASFHNECVPEENQIKEGLFSDFHPSHLAKMHSPGRITTLFPDGILPSHCINLYGLVLHLLGSVQIWRFTVLI